MSPEQFQITPEQFQQYAPAFMAGAIVLGLLFCFLGYRIFRIMLSAAGGIGGGGAAVAVTLNYWQWNEMWWAVVLIGLAAAAAGAVLLIIAYYVGVFVVGAAFAGTIAALLCGANAENLYLEALIPAAVVGGVLALIIQKFLIIMTTSFTGAAAVTAGAYYFIWGAAEFESLAHAEASVPSKLPLTEAGHIAFNALLREGVTIFQNNAHIGIALVWLLALGVIGMIVQYFFTARKKKKAPDPAQAPA